jgi:Xaa-Pro aminopeptidase
MQGVDYLRELRNSPRPQELAFSFAEYQARVARVRSRMAALGVDLLLVTSPLDLCYLAGYSTFSVDLHACLLVPRQGELVFQVSAMDIPAALLTGWIDRIEPYDWKERDQIPERLASLVREQGAERGRLGMELTGPALPVRLYRELRRLLPEAWFEDTSEVVFAVRQIKSPTELEYMRQAARLTAAGIRASYRAVATGSTDNDVARAGYDAMVGAGSEFLPVEPIVTSGRRSGWAHTTFKRTPLQAGDVVFLEYGGCYQRYTAPMMRTVSIGEPGPAVRRVADAVRTTVELVIENVRAGRTADDVARAARKGHAALDSEVYFQGVYGEATGLSFPPTLVEGSGRSAVIAEGVEQILQPGMTFHLPIAMRLPGKFCVGLSETIAVIESGCEILTEQQRDLVVVGA